MNQLGNKSVVMRLYGEVSSQRNIHRCAQALASRNPTASTAIEKKTLNFALSALSNK
jgi:hypothetical protein